MPLYSLKLSTYDPEIIDAFERLRKSRKQATYTHEAIKQFLATERGKQMLANMDGGTSDQQLLTLNSIIAETVIEKPRVKTISVISASASTLHDDGSEILSSILE